MVKDIKNKRAIAMIELIFALVIMGIVLMSAPMLIHQSIKSSNVALQQEAIATASSQTAIILSMHWDEKNTQAGSSLILDANRTSFKFPPAGLMDGGSPLVNLRTFLPINPKTPTINTNFGKDTNETTYTDFDDVDDYHNSDFSLILFNNETTTADIGEYVDTNISIKTTIRYTQENNVSKNITTGSFSNIKFIKVNLTSKQTDVPELEKDITFKAFSCNIGTYSIMGELK
jgi:type II secretory pathway pseudopilin PulG